MRSGTSVGKCRNGGHFDVLHAFYEVCQFMAMSAWTCEALAVSFILVARIW